MNTESSIYIKIKRAVCYLTLGMKLSSFSPYSFLEINYFNGHDYTQTREIRNFYNILKLAFNILQQL